MQGQGRSGEEGNDKGGSKEVKGERAKRVCEGRREKRRGKKGKGGRQEG